jgi:hypothetical protein
MHKRTKATQFSKATKIKIFERDEDCVFCKLGYSTDGAHDFDLTTYDPMHIINKSQGGLGIEENGAKGCRYHHNLMDNGNQGLREQMQEDLEIYMKSYYHDWNKKNLVYSKY